MTEGPVDEQEIARRRRKFEQILAAQAKDAERVTEIAQVDAARVERAKELAPVLAELVAGGSAAEFRKAVDLWSRKPGYSGFNSPNGQMFVNQMVNAASDEEVAEVLRQILTLPANDEEARSKLQVGVGFVTEIRKGSFPTPTRIPFLCSFFWGWQAPEVWPVSWPSAVRSLVDLAWLEPTGILVDDYFAYRDEVARLGSPPADVQYALHWFDKHRFVGLDPSLVERCARGVEIYEHRSDGAYAGDDERAEARLQARTTIAELRLLGRHLQDSIAEAVGRSVKAVVPGIDWAEGVFRADAWMTWRVGVAGGPGVMVWADAWGIGLGVTPGFARSGWWSEIPALIESKVPGTARVMRIGRTSGSSVPTPARRLFPEEDGRGTDCLIGWWYPGTEVLDDPAFAERCVEAASTLQPVLDALLIASQGPGGGGAPPIDEDDPLVALKERFISERAYPTAKDQEQHADREMLAAALAPDELLVGDLTELRSIINTGRYGRPGPMAELNRTLRDADPAGLERVLESLSYLCWGDGDVIGRIDAVLDPEDRGFRGLGESVIMKLLAITAPERFLPVFPYTGDMGKARMLKLLELDPPDTSLSRGARQVAANDRLRERLDPLFPGDPWGQAQFLYWLNATDLTNAGSGEGAKVDELEALADRLLVSKSFLEDIKALLEDKRQVVLYGPPGTGKTYLAQELAKVLAPDPNRRMLVQFHPSTSYEDFFEGYRPEETDGQLSYRLTKGPLALLAERAEAAPGQRHVMIIDEINRANLPKVLGELLFLLEYRGEAVRTLYRPDDSFLLPPDLWFIGTMNTADRSIALIDAAMRRRFHFVPFFPNDGAMEGLLARWLEREGEPGWVADLVDMVNAELVEELGGNHLQLGPSHFMKKGLNESQVARIWEYNIYPFVEDQLFGEPQRIARFKFAEVLKRFDALSGGTEPDDQTEHDELDGD